MIGSRRCFGSDVRGSANHETANRRGGKRGRSGRRYSRYAGEVLQFFSMNRMATAEHVRRYFSSLFRAERTVRLHLQTLTEAGDLSKLPHRHLGEPGMYVITSRGLKNAGSISDPGEYQQWKRRQAGSHAGHELLITEFAVRLAEAVRARSDLTIPYQERFGLAAEPLLRPVVPDYGFAFKHSTGQMLCFVEVSCGEESSTRLRNKLVTYAEWSRTPAAREFITGVYHRCGATAPRPEFRLLFVLQNRRTGNDVVRMRQLIAASMQIDPDLRRRLWLTTNVALMHHPALEQMIWTRGKDLDAIDREVANVAGAARRRLFHQLAAALPVHPLFPHEASNDTSKPH